MDVYLAGCYSRDYVFEEDIIGSLRILESFHYITPKFTSLIPRFKDFMLDSGAFTFLSGKGTVNWNEYIERYAEYIVENNIEKFFELDIDSIIGLDKVEKLREKLEALTGRKSIPVWHVSRGIDYYRWMCAHYSYIAIGGIVTGEIKKTQYKYFPEMISIAKSNGVKIHGLGFTRPSMHKKLKFHSVDSSTWLCGNRFGFLYKFSNGNMLELRDKKTKRPRINLTSEQIAKHNFREWIKYQRYAKLFL